MNELLHFDRFGTVVIATVRDAPRLEATNAAAFGEALDHFITAHVDAHLLVNLSHVEYISSAILRELLRAHKALQAKGGGLRVCGANTYVHQVFAVTNLDAIFLLDGSVREAAEAYIRSLPARE